MLGPSIPRRRMGATWRPASLLLLALLGPALFSSCGGSDGEPVPADAALPPRIPWTQPIHVVVFLIDTLRADRLSLYGYERPTSPNLEVLAAESVVFEHASAAAPWTLPSVTSLMLSTFLPTHGVVAEQDRIAEDAVTIAERLTELGYRTRSVYHNPYVGPMCGLDRGFERATPADRVVGARDVEEAFTEDDPRPLFLYLHNVIPHDPYRPDPKFLERFGKVPQGGIDRVARTLRAYRSLTRHNRPGRRPPARPDTSPDQTLAMAALARGVDTIDLLYDAEVAEVDEEVGRAVATLKRLGVWDHTLFVLVADHGEEMGEHGGWEHDQSLYGELVHVPLLIHFPGGAFAGEHIAEPVSLLSIAPTILEAVGRPPWSERFGEGSSLFDLLGPGLPAAGPRVVSVRLNRKKYYAPFDALRGDENIALREGMWKGIWNVGPDTFELYDLASDPGETRDLSGDQPVRSRAFLEAARAWREEHPPPPETSRETEGRANGGLSADQRAALRALGYVDEDGR